MRRTRTPDLRLSWRDPNMPVLRDYIMGDGSRKHIVDPDYERRYREHLMQLPDERPRYKLDPTYNLRKPKS